MKRKSRLRDILLNIFLAGAACVVVLLALEVVLRATHAFGARRSWSEPDRRIGWKYTAGRDWWLMKENDHPISGTVNSYGWIDRERTRAKAPNTFRVAVLGDSYVEAMQVETESTFVSIAERDLANDSERTVEILNFGRSGMTQAEQWITLRETVAGFSPDMVVVVFIPQNDIADINPRTAIDTMRPFFRLEEDGRLESSFDFVDSAPFRTRQRINTIKQNSALVSLMTERYNILRRARRARSPATQAQKPTSLWAHLTLCTNTPDPIYAANYEVNKRILREMADWCQQRSIAFMLMTNALVYMPDQVEYCRDIDPSFDPSFFDRDLSRWAADRGVGFAGLHEEFSRHLEMTGERCHWSHWNYTGHRVVARVLAKQVRHAITGRN